MANPQQPELRRSGKVPDLDPDATEAVLSAEERPKTSRARKPVPEEQQPGHHPDEEQDKPDMEAFAERLGIPSEGDEPDDAPHVEPQTTRPAKKAAKRPKRGARKGAEAPAAEQLAEAFDVTERARAERRKPPVKLLLLGPAVTYVGARAVYRGIVRVIRR